MALVTNFSKRTFTKSATFLAVAVSVVGVATSMQAISVSAKSKPASQPITLTISEWTNVPAITATKLIDSEFEKAHPGVKINLVYAPNPGPWPNLVNSEMAAHNVDVLGNYPIGGNIPKPYMKGLQPSQTENEINAGEFKNLAGMKFINQDFLPGLQQKFMGYKKGIWGVTEASYGIGGVWYNESLFAKYHLSVSKTFNELLHVCQVFQSHGVIPIQVGAEHGYDQMITAGAMQQEIPHQQAAALNYGLWTGKITWANDPVFTKVMTRYSQLSKYFEPNAFGTTNNESYGPFETGKAAMFENGSWAGFTIYSAHPHFKYSWFPLPMTNDPAKNQMQVTPDFTWMVPSQAPHVSLALQYIQFFSEPVHYLQWEKLVGAIPTEKMATLSLPWMTTTLKYLPTSQQEFSIMGPNNAGPLAYAPADTSSLKPQGPYTVGKLLQEATKQWLAAVK
ncbi:MAG: ABC transporter substrate-binding protein [Acidobacteria bacterium]|nr:ABC transporter substrate-binding protein [Acidobacteriota bacterium]